VLVCQFSTFKMLKFGLLFSGLPNSGLPFSAPHLYDSQRAATKEVINNTGTIIYSALAATRRREEPETARMYYLLADNFPFDESLEDRTSRRNCTVEQRV